MIFDKSGSLANVKRHDYLPFGEELFANQNGRTTAQGYPVATPAPDGIRNQFTSQERDNETGLDYMHARYFSSMQGRFSSADTFAGSTASPQSLNRYTYVMNNPLNFSDPTGHVPSTSYAGPASILNPNDPVSVAMSYGALPDHYENEITRIANMSYVPYCGDGIVQSESGETGSDEDITDYGAIALTETSLGEPSGGAGAIKPCSIDINFGGSKSPDNNLVMANPEQKLEYFETPNYYAQQVEITGTVTGKGWRINQTVTSFQHLILANGLDLNPTTRTNPKDAPNPSKQQWGPGKKFFAVDSPGLNKVPGGYKSAYQVQNFNTSVTNGKATCSVKWGTILRVSGDKVSFGIGLGHYPLKK